VSHVALGPVSELAHGVGTRADLPIPLPLALVASALAVVASFAALGLLWPSSRLHGPSAGRPVPAGLQRVLDSAALRLLAQEVTLGVFLVVVAVALVGPATIADNLAPWALYVTFWVGLVPASLLLGPLWRVLNPLRALHQLLAALARIDPVAGVRAYPDRLGYWPAAATLLAFAWLELAYPDRAEPRVVGAFLVCYAAVQLGAALVYGARWFERGDGFEVYSTLLGRLAPLGRRGDGRIVVRNPLQGADTVEPSPGLVAVVCVLVGSTVYDGLTRTAAFQELVGGEEPGVLVGTATLALCVAAIAALYLAATARSAAAAGTPLSPHAARFAHSVLPIAAGYAIAHYFSLLVFDGQRTLALAADPFGLGWNLLGTADWQLNYTLVSTTTISVIQVAAILLGHLVGVVLAHDRAVRLLPQEKAIASQYPVLGLMVLLTVTGIGLLLSA